MPYTIDWYIENQVIYARLLGTVTPEEYRTLLQISAFMMEEIAAGEVHVINDVSSVEKMVSFADMIKAVPKRPPPHIGWMVIVGETSPIKRFWGEIFARLAPIRYKRVDTLEDAVDFLRKHDATLTEILASAPLPTSDDKLSNAS